MAAILPAWIPRERGGEQRVTVAAHGVRSHARKVPTPGDMVCVPAAPTPTGLIPAIAARILEAMSASFRSRKAAASLASLRAFDWRPLGHPRLPCGRSDVGRRVRGGLAAFTPGQSRIWLFAELEAIPRAALDSRASSGTLGQQDRNRAGSSDYFVGMSLEPVTLRTPLSLTESEGDAVVNGEASDELVQRFYLLGPWRHIPRIRGGLVTVADLLLDFPSLAVADRLHPVRDASTGEAIRRGTEAATGIQGVYELALASGDMTRVIDMFRQGTERETGHLVCGTFHPRGGSRLDSTLQLRDGTSLTVRTTDAAVPTAQEDVWAAVQLQPATNGLNVEVGLEAWLPANYEHWLPNYPGHTLAERFLRSYLCALLSQVITLPDSESAGLRKWLLAIHAPWSRETAEQAARPEFREAVTGAVGRLLSAAPALPEPRLIKSHREAEEYAAEVLRALGYGDAVPTPPGSDGGVDVRSQWAVAQVKMEAAPTGRPPLQAITGVARVEAVDAIFFSLAGYTAQALEWAELAGVACFEFAFDGSIEPRGTRARLMLANGKPLSR
jgi:hypothetical protein